LRQADFFTQNKTRLEKTFCCYKKRKGQYESEFWRLACVKHIFFTQIKQGWKKHFIL
jgi:hypothetical protein